MSDESFLVEVVKEVRPQSFSYSTSSGCYHTQCINGYTQREFYEFPGGKRVYSVGDREPLITYNANDKTFSFDKLLSDKKLIDLEKFKLVLRNRHRLVIWRLEMETRKKSNPFISRTRK